MTPRTFLDLYRAKDRLVGPMREGQFRILLDLAEHGTLAAKALALGAGLPATTGLNHLLRLETAGLIERASAEADRRRTLWCLTARGRALFELEAA